MSSTSVSTMVMLVILVIMMYFFMIRPQRKQRDAHQEMMSKLQPGDEVVTIGRLHGVVNEINQKEKTVTLDCEGIYLTFDLIAIQRVVSHEQTAAQTDAAADNTDSQTADSQSAASESAASEGSANNDSAADSADESAEAASDSAADTEEK